MTNSEMLDAYQEATRTYEDSQVGTSARLRSFVAMLVAERGVLRRFGAHGVLHDYQKGLMP